MSPGGLTVIVPCFNEAAGIEGTHAQIVAALAGVEDLELLYIDDGSRDGTLDRLRALAAADPRVRYLSFARNFGLAAAVTAGFRYAGKDWIAQVDADLQNPPEELWKLLDKAAEGYDVVFGVREHRRDPLLRRWGASAHHWIARRLLGIDVPAGASSFRVLRAGVAQVLAGLREGGPYFVAMVPMIGARYTCVGTAHRPREGRSRFRPARLIGHTFELYFGYSWRPLNALYLVAAIGAVAALVAACFGAALTGTATLLLAAAGLAATALVARYLQRLMLEQRPARRFYVREANFAVDAADRVDGGVPPVPPPTRTAPALLVLGAGEEQVPVYREAARRGLHTIAVDRATGRPALPYAGEHLQLSTKDPEPIAAALHGRALAGVVTAGSDHGLATWAALTARFGMPYRFPAGAARVSVDKAAFHAVSAAAGVASYRWRQHHDRAALAAADLVYPLIVKPVAGSGSRGVSLVHDATGLPAALAHAADGELLVEEYLTGRNLTVDVFMRGGAAAFTGITEKRIVPGPHFVIGGHTCPAALDEPTRARVEATAATLCRAVDLADGPANLDVVLGADGAIRVLELNARLCGNAVPLLMRAVYGVDTVAALVSLAVGEPFELAPRLRCSGVVHVVASPLEVDGVVTAVSGVDAVRAMPGVVHCAVYAEPGQTVHPFTEGGHKLGHLLVTGADAAEAEERLTAALGVLRVDIEPLDRAR